MPASDDEQMNLVYALVEQTIAPDMVSAVKWQDGSTISNQELAEIFALAIYEIRRRRKANPVAQRKAMRLLKRHLSSEQKRQLRMNNYFYVTAASGKVYRLSPKWGSADGVEQHGNRFYEAQRFCLHEFVPLGQEMPPADLSLAHMLLLACDEPAFLAEANATPVRQMQWDGAWRRRLNRARREEAARRTEPQETPIDWATMAALAHYETENL